MNLLRSKSQIFQYRVQEGMTLAIVRAREFEGGSSAPTHGWIQSIKSISAHHYNGGKVSCREVVNATDQRIYTCTIFVVHLTQFARLSQGVCFINQQDDSGIV